MYGGHVGVRSKPRRGYKSVQWQPSSTVSANKPTVTTQPPPTTQSQALLLSSSVIPNGHASEQTNVSPHVVSPLSKQYPNSLPQPKNNTAQAQLSPPPPPTSLPDKPPSRSIILWLCERITNWKMIARFFEFDGSEIERIVIDYDTVVEQRFQMFDSWQRHETREYSYRTLGDVLWNSESNRHLYREFYRKVMASD